MSTNPSPFGVTGHAGMFGDGSDGAVTLDGSTTFNNWSGLIGSTYTMTRDVFATSLTINSGVTLVPASARIFVAGPVVINGTVNSIGGNASGATGGTAAITNTISLGKAGAGGNGQTGNGSAGGSTNGLGSANAGAGGAGGTGTAGNAGSGFSSAKFMLRPPAILAVGVVPVGSTGGFIDGGPGGGGGGGDGTNAGGGGGGGGGVVAIAAYTVVNAGTISVAGGNGANGVAGNAGGGGGGSGGLILVYTLSAWTAGTATISGGNAGTKTGTGGNGNPGGAGTALNVLVQ